MSDKVASTIGMILLSAFLLGLAESIGHPPFWVIVVLVLIGGWCAAWQDGIRNQDH